jgi:hypothetical protein
MTADSRLLCGRCASAQEQTIRELLHPATVVFSWEPWPESGLFCGRCYTGSRGRQRVDRPVEGNLSWRIGERER